MTSLPHCKTPCPNCPFKKDAIKGWLGAEGMRFILEQRTFVCHKRRNLQCAGHMLINGKDNDFVMLASRLKIPLSLYGRELVFDTKEQCIEHHARGR